MEVGSKLRGHDSFLGYITHSMKSENQDQVKKASQSGVRQHKGAWDERAHNVASGNVLGSLHPYIGWLQYTESNYFWTHFSGGQEHVDIFLHWVSIALGLGSAMEAGGSSQCPQLCWEGLGQVQWASFSSCICADPWENARDHSLEDEVWPLCQPSFELSLKLVLWANSHWTFNGQGFPQSGSLKFCNLHATLYAVYLSDGAVLWESCVIPVMQSDRENKNTQLRKSHNVNVKHKLSVHLNLSLF